MRIWAFYCRTTTTLCNRGILVPAAAPPGTRTVLIVESREFAGSVDAAPVTGILMDILWAALAMSAIVSVAFYVLAISWQRTLKGHSRAIRALFQRLESMEAMEDPLMRRRIGELMPSPLEQVHVLSFRLGERFWRDTLGASEQQVRYVHENGTFVGSVKIEVWRSHSAITLTELLPQNRSAGWQTRRLDVYSGDSEAPCVLWEMRSEPARNSSVTESSSAELRYENGVIVLAARVCQGSPRFFEDARADETIVFRIPLDAGQLAEFRVSEADIEARGLDAKIAADGPVALFSHYDERQDVDWQLRIRELESRSTSENWAIMDPPQVRRVS